MELVPGAARRVQLTCSISTARACELNYDMPLNEIIYDFFDALEVQHPRLRLAATTSSRATAQSNWSSWIFCSTASMVRRALHHRAPDKAYARGRAHLREARRTIIPRQLFEIPIQAAIGGKVIARETVKAMRKDVLAKCYGGDITRKKKLLEKQKEGKKRMRQFGTVQVPSEAFLAVLKMDSN